MADEEMSVAETLAAMSEEERNAYLDGLDVETLEYDPEFWLRPSQLAAMHSETWLTLLLAGRGAGKTKTLSEWVRDKAKTPNTRIALVARTVSDVRDTMVNGESGILAVCPDEERPEYVPSARILRWKNGSTALTFSAEKPGQLRGPQFHYTACDEIGAWDHTPDNSGLNAWDNLTIGTRLGRNPQIMAATTPKRIKLIRDLIELAKTDSRRVHLYRSTTASNLANLSASYIETIYGMYANTSIARQELWGEMLDEIDGALWQDAIIDRIDRTPTDILGSKYLRVVGVDPSVSSRKGDECGIVACAATRERARHLRNLFVLEDRSMQAGPDEWTKQVVRVARRWGAIVVAEQNQGGDLVKMAIQQADPKIPVIMVHASKGKAVRAEPVVMAYEQGRGHHIGHLELLEDEMTSWVPGESSYSPGRLDALVWAASSLLVDDRKLMAGTGQVRVSRRSATASLGPALVPAYRRNRGTTDRHFNRR